MVDAPAGAGDGSPAGRSGRWAFPVIRDAIPVVHPDVPYATLIDKEIDRIAHIVRETLDLYRPHPEPARRLVVERAVEEVAAVLEPHSRASEVEVRVEVDRVPDEVWLPEGPLHQVLFNLIENALEASPRGGRVTVGVTTLGDRLSLTVTDQGAGIPAALHGRIFEPFFTTKERRSGGGVGLGLAVSRSLVQAMGGELASETAPGRGARFVVLLPVRRDETVPLLGTDG